ncbi:MAG: hypothetical protein WCX32_02970 [Clostridia bacterium]|nr:hypothetical protein [Clostridia bacterium]
MKATKQVLKLIAIVLFVTVINSVSFGYGFFDKTGYVDSAILNIGSWEYLTTYNTGFQSFNNYYIGTTNITIDGQYFKINNVVTASSSNDLKIGTKSVKIAQTGYLQTNNTFLGLNTVSFYIGLRKNSSTKGNRYYYLEISNNTSNWAIIYTGQATSSFVYKEIDVAQILSNGVTLYGTTLTGNTPLYVRLRVNGSGTFGIRTYNIDELTIKYIS